MPVQLSRDRFSLVLCIALLAFSGACVWHGDVDWKTATGFLTGAIFVPGLVMRKNESSNDSNKA